MIYLLIKNDIFLVDIVTITKEFFFISCYQLIMFLTFINWLHVTGEWNFTDFNICVNPQDNYIYLYTHSYIMCFSIEYMYLQYIDYKIVALNLL